MVSTVVNSTQLPLPPPQPQKNHTLYILTDTKIYEHDHFMGQHVTNRTAPKSKTKKNHIFLFPVECWSDSMS